MIAREEVLAKTETWATATGSAAGTASWSFASPTATPPPRTSAVASMIVVPRSGMDTLQRYEYTGRELASESAEYYFRYRVYGPALGQFFTRDPLGYADGMGLYSAAYTCDLSMDPYGKFSVLPWAVRYLAKKLAQEFLSSHYSTPLEKVNRPETGANTICPPGLNLYHMRDAHFTRVDHFKADLATEPNPVPGDLFDMAINIMDLQVTTKNQIIHEWECHKKCTKTAPPGLSRLISNTYRPIEYPKMVNGVIRVDQWYVHEVW